MAVPTDRDQVLALSLPELGMAILRGVAHAPATPNPNSFIRGYFATLPPVSAYPGGVTVVGGRSPEDDRELAQALLEAWQWLEHEGLVAKNHLEGGGWYFVTRRGRGSLVGSA